MSKLREAIFNAQDIQREQVTVPEWSVTVEVRGMTGTERAAFMEGAFDLETGKPHFDKLYPEIIIQACYDPEDGSRVFEATDRDMLNSKAASATERIAKVAMRLSGLGEDAVAAGKAV